MGRVYDYEQTKHSADAIPTHDDFEAAIDNFGQAAQAEISLGNVCGAVIYGSVAIRAYTLRSDFDCLLVPVDHSPGSIAAINRIITSTDPSRKIDVSAIVHPRERLSNGSHEIDRYFGEHLTGDSRLVYGQDPAAYIAYPNYGPYLHLIAYIRHKKRSIAAGFMTEGNDYLKGLQRILELPLAVGRKTLRAVDEINGTHLATSDSANKMKITPASLGVFDSFELGEVPRSLLNLNAEYNDLLAAAIASELSEQDYVAVLEKISLAGASASNWLDELDAHITRSYS